jgi:Protein of unknown function (DUF3768)
MTDHERNCQDLTNDSRRTEAIQALNDRFRRTLRGGKVLVTSGVNALGAAHVHAILTKVVEFDAFGPDNDPYQEHDFGAFDHVGNKLFWKIDYYDPSLTSGSTDPSDAAATCRVLTIMLAEEY